MDARRDEQSTEREKRRGGLITTADHQHATVTVWPIEMWLLIRSAQLNSDQQQQASKQVHVLS